MYLLTSDIMNGPVEYFTDMAYSAHTKMHTNTGHFKVLTCFFIWGNFLQYLKITGLSISVQQGLWHFIYVRHEEW